MRNCLAFKALDLAFAACCIVDAATAQAGKKCQRLGLRPCRIAAQARIGYLDDEQRASGEYAHVCRMVDTCAPDRKPEPVFPLSDRTACCPRALKVLDELDEGRLNGRAFVSVHDDFPPRCPPPPGIAPKAPS